MEPHVLLNESNLIGILLAQSWKYEHLQANAKKEFTPAQFNELSPYKFHTFVVRRVLLKVKQPASVLHVFLVFVQQIL
jgi:hypothetical protein